jgi:hypothetical protein
MLHDIVQLQPNQGSSCSRPTQRAPEPRQSGVVSSRPPAGTPQKACGAGGEPLGAEKKVA